jgi:hypothetical protein
MHGQRSHMNYWKYSYVIRHFVLRLDPFGAEEILKWLLLLATVIYQLCSFSKTVMRN